MRSPLRISDLNASEKKRMEKFIEICRRKGMIVSISDEQGLLIITKGEKTFTRPISDFCS